MPRTASESGQKSSTIERIALSSHGPSWRSARDGDACPASDAELQPQVGEKSGLGLHVSPALLTAACEMF